MNVLEAIAARRSVRAYAPRAVEEEKIQALVQAANQAPIFGSLHLTVVEDPALLAEIDRVTLDCMRASGDAFLERRAATEGYAPLYGAPVLIVLSAPGGNDSNGFAMANVSCAAENMLLAATGLGLGGCFVMGIMLALRQPALAARLRLPEGHVPLVGVLAGYAAGEAARAPRETPANVTRLQ